MSTGPILLIDERLREHPSPERRRSGTVSGGKTSSFRSCYIEIASGRERERFNFDEGVV
jgi:hypothetical protein